MAAEKMRCLDEGLKGFMEGRKQMKVNSAFFLKNILAVLFLKLISNLKIIKK